MRKISMIFTICFFLLFSHQMNVQAAYSETIDLQQKGSISVTMYDRINDRPVKGSELELIRIASVQDENADLSFQYIEAFEDCPVSLERDQELTAAVKHFELYIDENKIAGKKRSSDRSGQIFFEQVKPGLYLLRQSQAAEGYHSVNAFIISVPLLNEIDGTWIYDVDATPKMEILQIKPENSTDNSTNKPGSSAGYTGTGNSGYYSSRLPQTGQQTWMIYIMAVSGLILFMAGWLLLSGRKKN